MAAKRGLNAAAKIVALVAGMVAGADSIIDMDLLRHGGTGRLFDEVRAPSTLGTFWRLSPSVTSASSTRLPLGCSRGCRSDRGVVRGRAGGAEPAVERCHEDILLLPSALD